MKKKAPIEVAKILDSIKESTNLGKQLRQAKIWESWNDLAGVHLSGHGQPKAIRDKRLTIEAESPVWMHRYALRKWDILKRINAMAGEELVSDIFVVLREDDPPESDAKTSEKPT